MKKGDIWGFISLLIILGGLALLFVFAPRNPEVAFAPIEVPGSSVTLVAVDATSVTVDAVLGKSGFLTLHQLIGGAPGPIVATSDYLAAGTHAGYQLSVPRGLDLQMDYMMLMMADGGNATYDAGVDLPVMVDGEVIRVPVTYTPDDASSSVQE